MKSNPLNDLLLLLLKQHPYKDFLPLIKNYPPTHSSKTGARINPPRPCKDKPSGSLIRNHFGSRY
jgi:hypothetical protein